MICLANFSNYAFDCLSLADKHFRGFDVLIVYRERQVAFLHRFTFAFAAAALNVGQIKLFEISSTSSVFLRRFL